MRLYLMRHGIAIDREDPECPAEEARYLTPDGIEKTKEVGRGLRELGVEPEVFLTSPLVRAVQTAELVADAFDFSRTRIRRTDTLRYPMHQAEFFRELSTIKAKDVICFGHAPPLDEAIAYAVGVKAPFTELKKAGVACLELESISPPRGILLWLMTPKALRKAAH
ncbi:MAG: histidine phosphatase family protein [Acidobacteria bacterium]|nr:histidine phosphatase family protein [Acidobacteriota bacterium]